MERTGEVHRVSGPVVTATGITPKMYDVVLVGDEGLMGEVIEIHHEKLCTLPYEDTSYSLSNPPTRTRNNRHLAIESFLHDRFPSFAHLIERYD